MQVFDVQRHRAGLHEEDWLWARWRIEVRMRRMRHISIEF